jgi:hypothetical protein
VEHQPVGEPKPLTVPFWVVLACPAVASGLEVPEDPAVAPSLVVASSQPVGVVPFLVVVPSLAVASSLAVACVVVPSQAAAFAVAQEAAACPAVASCQAVVP